jgi:Uma2 family endonuclease
MHADHFVEGATLEPMASPPKNRRQALYDEYLAVPEYRRAEIIDGTLYVMSRPAPRHANATSVLGSELNAAFQRARGGPGGWWILDEPELHLVPLEPLSPDIAGWRVERMPDLPSTAHFELAPDWVCEVLSRSTESIDRTKKLPIYARHGIGHVWLIDSIEKFLEAHILDDQHGGHRVTIYDRDARVRIAPFEAIEIDLAALWSAPAPR